MIILNIEVYDNKTQILWNNHNFVAKTETILGLLIERINTALEGVDKNSLRKKPYHDDVPFLGKECKEKRYEIRLGLYALTVDLSSINTINFYTGYYHSDCVNIKIHNKTRETIFENILQGIRKFSDDDDIQNDEDFIESFKNSPYGKTAFVLIEDMIDQNMKNRNPNPDTIYWDFMDIIDQTNKNYFVNLQEEGYYPEANS